MQYHNMDVFREHVNDRLDCLDTSQGAVDLQPLFFKFILDTTTTLLLGRSVYSLRVGEDTDAGNIALADKFDKAQR